MFIGGEDHKEREAGSKVRCQSSNLILLLAIFSNMEWIVFLINVSTSPQKPVSSTSSQINLMGGHLKEKMEAGFVFIYLKCVTTLLQCFLSLIVAHTKLTN